MECIVSGCLFGYKYQIGPDGNQRGHLVGKGDFGGIGFVKFPQYWEKTRQAVFLIDDMVKWFCDGGGGGGGGGGEECFNQTN